MNNQLFKRTTWILVVIFTTLIYVVVTYIDLSLPCKDSFFIGLCGLGRIILVILALILIATYYFCVFIQWKSTRHYENFIEILNKRVSLVSLLFLIIPITYILVSLRSNPDLMPYALESLQKNGKGQIHFMSFSDTPVYDQAKGKLIGLQLRGTIVVDKAGTYTIYPMRLMGLIPIRVLDTDNRQNATEIRQYLKTKTPYEFVYFAGIEPLEVTNKGYSSSYVEQIEQAKDFSWKVLWKIESYPPFPIYLFGIGSVAQVYPDDSGEYAYITHVNSKFQTQKYPRENFDIR